MFSSWKSSTAEAAFHAADSDGDGRLSLDELVAAAGTLRNRAPPRARIHNLMNKYDADSDGQLDLKEFKTMVAYLERGHAVQDELSEVWTRLEAADDEIAGLRLQLSAANVALASAQAAVATTGKIQLVMGIKKTGSLGPCTVS